MLRGLPSRAARASSGAHPFGTTATKPLRISMVGSGNWGCAVAKLVAENAATNSRFDPEVRMWVYEEKVDGENLTEIINTRHENVKYLPGVKLPANLKAVSDLKEATDGADAVVFNLPHQFLPGSCKGLGTLAPGAFAVTCIKGMFVKQGEVELCSEFIVRTVKEAHGFDMPCAALSGANVASGVGQEEFAEATIGHPVGVDASALKDMFARPYFAINTIPDAEGVQLGGALKNVVALGAGFIDGMDLGSNTKAATLRFGLAEMIRLSKTLYPSVKSDTFLESCGVADLITTCYAGRNRKCAEAFARARQSGSPKSWEVIEKELLNGQKLQGTLTAEEVHEILETRGLLADFPFMRTVYDISFNNAEFGSLIKVMGLK